jgi:radical SAM superfamily enzyme YgiQ (UPF0313 family)
LSVANDPVLLDLLRESGCRQVLIGLESPASGPLQGIEMRRNFKARVAEHYTESLRRIQAHGVTVNGCFILGLDGHTTSIFQEVLEFARAVPLYDVQITVLTAFPGTPLYARLLAEGRVLEPGRWDLCTLFDVNYKPSDMSPRELQEGIYWLTERLYGDECTAFRRQGFFSNLRRQLRRRPHAAA